MILRPDRRGDLSDQQWPRLKPLLPAQKPDTGRPSNDHRTVINGILWVLRTGAPWRDIPECYGAWQTVSGRFYYWRKIGLWQQILQRLQQLADADGNSIGTSISWMVVSSVLTNMQQGQKGGPGPQQ